MWRLILGCALILPLLIPILYKLIELSFKNPSNLLFILAMILAGIGVSIIASYEGKS